MMEYRFLLFLPLVMCMQVHTNCPLQDYCSPGFTLGPNCRCYRAAEWNAQVSLLRQLENGTLFTKTINIYLAVIATKKTKSEKSSMPAA